MWRRSVTEGGEGGECVEKQFAEIERFKIQPERYYEEHDRSDSSNVIWFIAIHRAIYWTDAIMVKWGARKNKTYGVRSEFVLGEIFRAVCYHAAVKSNHPLVVEAIDRSVYPWVLLSSAVVPLKSDSPVPGVKNGNARHNKIASTIRLMIKLLMQRPTEQCVQVWALMDRSSTSIRR